MVRLLLSDPLQTGRPDLSSAYTLIGIVNRRINDAKNLSALLQSIIDVSNQVLRPTCCFIWLLEDKFRGIVDNSNHVMYSPATSLSDAQGHSWSQSETRPVVDLEADYLRTTFLEAGVTLVTPLICQEKVIGWLGLGAPQQKPEYNRHEISFLEILAGQGAIAIHCFWLQTKLASYAPQLRQAYRHTIQVQEEERRRLAETLHDETLQHLADISVRLGLLRRQVLLRRQELLCRQELLRRQNNAEIKALDDLHRRVAHADRRLREIVRGVHPAILSDLGLVDAVIAFLEGVSLPHYRSPIRLELLAIGFSKGRLSDQKLELALYRFVQNATLNALTHARPQAIYVTLGWGIEEVTVQVKDDGCGMRMALEEAVRAGHFGLLNMRERIAAHGGTFYLSSAPDKGTQVMGRILFPTSSPAPEVVERYMFDLR